jgi:hypothetical protein
MKIALIKTKLSTEPLSSNQQQANSKKKTEEQKPQKKSKERIKNQNRNLPHTNWSLHNRPTRKIRNIISELPTQNVPALPQNSSPLVGQHRSHSCSK